MGDNGAGGLGSRLGSIDIGKIGLNHWNGKDLLYDRNILNRWRKVRVMLKKGDIGRHAVLLGFKRVTLIPFLKA